MDGKISGAITLSALCRTTNIQQSRLRESSYKGIRMTTHQPLRIGAVQCSIHTNQVQENLLQIRTALIQHQSSADLFVFPEAITTAFSKEAGDYATEWTGEVTQYLQSLANEFGVGLAGSLLCKDQGRMYNRFFLFAPSEPVQWQDKRHLFSLGGEVETLSAATERRILRFRGWRIMPLVCYDLRFPVWCRSRHNDYDLMLVVANWPTPRREVWRTLLRARAMENLCYVVGVNRIGQDGAGLDYSGDSLIIDPRGQGLVEERPREDCLLTATIDYPSLQQLRDKFPVWRDADDFEITN